MNNLCIQVNNNCNFNCNYCRAKTDEEITSLNLEEIKKFLEEKREVVAGKNEQDKCDEPRQTRKGGVGEDDIVERKWQQNHQREEIEQAKP